MERKALLPKGAGCAIEYTYGTCAAATLKRPVRA